MKKLLLLIGFVSLTMNAQVPSYVPTNGLVGYWPFSGNANDVSGNANNGINNGATLTTDRFGNVNSAYSFNGVNNFISTNTSSILFPTGITFCAWINPIVYKDASIVDKMLNSGSGFRINTRENSISIGVNPKKIWSQCAAYVVISTNITAVSNSDQNLNNWQFIVGTFGSDGKLKIYYNGLLENEITTSYNVSNNSPILIGRGSTSATYENFQGYIDDVGVWNRVLTSQEIGILYNGGQTLTPFCSTDVFVPITNVSISSNDAVVYNNEIYTVDLWNTPKKIVKYNPISNIVSTVFSPTIPTLGESSLAVLNDKFYCFGGWTGSAASNLAYVYDAVLQTWTSLPNLPVNITETSAVVLNGNIYITGGTLGTTQQYFLKFNPTNNTYTQLSVPSVQRLNSKLVAYNNNIYCLGGHIGSPSPHAVNNFDKYDLVNNTWSALPNMPVGLTKIAATIKGNYVYSFGGSLYNGAFSTQYGYMAYDFINSNWITSTELIPGNTDNSAAVSINDAIYIVNYAHSYKYFCDTSLSANLVNNNSSFKVYPNPAKEFVMIDCGDSIDFKNYHFQLVNALGQVVISQNLNSQLQKIILDKFSGQGLYFIKIFNQENKLVDTKKIILQ